MMKSSMPSLLMSPADETDAPRFSNPAGPGMMNP